MRCSDTKLALACSLLALVMSGTALSQTYGELVQDALEQRNQGDFAAAEVLLRQAHESASDQRETYYLLAMTIAFQDRHEEAEAMLERALERYPDDLNLQLAWARVQSFQGEFGDARTRVDEVLIESPANSEALNLAGRLALYQNQPNRAMQYYQSVLELDPSNLEAQVGMYDAHFAAGDREAANRWLERAEDTAPTHPDVVSRRDRQVVEEPSWQVTYGYGNSYFERISLSDWNDFFVEAHRLDTDGNDFYARVEGQTHFGMSDTLVSLGTVRNTRGSMPWGARLDLSPDAVFVPDYRVNLFLAPRVREGNDRLGATVINLSAQHSSYAAAEVSELGLAVDQYFFNGRLWLTPSTNLVFDENSDSLSGWNLRANLLLGDRLLIGGGYGEAPQTENAATAITRTGHLFGRLSLSDRADLRLDLVREDREDSYLRYGATLAFTWKY